MCRFALLWVCTKRADIDDCTPDPCLHGGTCVDGVNKYTCTCAPGYEDINCQTGWSNIA